METVLISTTEKRQVVDITNQVAKQLMPDAKLCHVFVKHTTCAISIADLDPGGTDQDYLDAFEEMIPAHGVGEARPNGRPKLKFRHPHDPSHMPDHILSTLIGVSETIPIKDGQLGLGQWQRIVLFEFNGPQERQITITTF